MNIFSHGGDHGDICGALPVIRQLGGGELILFPHHGPGHPREVMTQTRANFILPLLVTLPYISAARFEEHPPKVTHDIANFRHKCSYRKGESLSHWQARHVGLHKHSDVDLSPWIHVEPNRDMIGRIAIARSSRYHNSHFKWPRIMDKYGKRAFFLGTPEEHAAFCKTFGEIPHHKVKDALEMAQVISGSEILIANQSFPCWLGLAMGGPLIQESCPQCPNSRVPRGNARFILHNFHL